MRETVRLIAPFILSATVLSVPASAAVGFNKDVRPILSDKCFHCHGPDEHDRKGGIRLDVREAALKVGESGAAPIVPGKPDESEALVRALSNDKEEAMPPPKSKLPRMTPEEIAVIKQWIAEGAKYEKHWSFNPVQPPTAQGIDPLVETQLATRGLKLQPEADRTTLVRRVSFDLTGLPPTPEEVEAFVKDSAPNAYEKLVDRLLASPRYGERMAVDWLDISRYADSYGFQRDNDRETWPWRDWVIKSFNSNLPFDQFITWQLAGDLLPNATDEQILATAFNRLHQQENEGGSVPEEYRVEYVADRVQTFSTAFLGLTFECARCHDHKFDPLTQKEYYQFFSMFQNINESGLYSFFTNSTPTPTLPLTDAPTKQKLADLRAKVASEEWKLVELAKTKRDAFRQWLTAGNPEIKPAGEIGRFSFDALEKGKLANSVNDKLPAVLAGENKLVDGKVGKAVEFTGDDPVNLSIGNYHAYQPFSVSLWLKTPDRKERAVVFHRSRAWTDAGSRGYELLIEDGKLKWSLIHFWPGNSISIRTRAEVPLNAWTHVVVSNDGGCRASGLRIYVNGKPAGVEVVDDALTRDITGGGGDTISLGERFRDRGLKGGAIDDFRVFERELTPLEAQLTSNPSGETLPVAKTDRPELFEYYLSTVDADYARQLQSVKDARSHVVKATESLREIMVMRELPNPKKAYTLFRGMYDQRRDEVGAGTPAALSPFPEGAPKNRLGLAKWLLDPQHPLTARVLVNRFWQAIFGRGLVKTSEDFGSQGALPVYPEVLDFLSWRFTHNGWDTKALIKTIVMSQVYRQQSIADAKTMADDPDNDWLARGPSVRLSAEMIRDNALATAGLLSEKLGGAPVIPYEMSEAFNPANPSGGDGVHRRSIYTIWRRTSPPPAMVTFDAPRRAVCAAKRERTDSPLQALILLNGTQYVEAARVLGTKLHRDAKGDVNMMIEQGFLRCLSRKPDQRERDICAQLYREQLAYFQAKPAEAAAILKTGAAPLPADIPAPAAAAAAVLGQALLNHDACVMKR